MSPEPPLNFNSRRDIAEVQDTDLRWCNPVRGLVVAAEGALRMELVEYDEDPGKADPGAAPYWSTCRADLDEGD